MALALRLLRCSGRNTVFRSLSTKGSPQDVFDALQKSGVFPDEYSGLSPSPENDTAPVRQPVTSAHMIINNAVSDKDAVSVSSDGKIIHGQYGDLGVQEGIPLEFLALLRPAAEAAAATSKLGHSGTLVVFGATQAAGLAAVQLWKGGAVVAVVGGEHSGNDEMMGIVKELTKEPGFAAAEEFALQKKNFSDMVDAAANGSKIATAAPDNFLSEFKENVLAYSSAYPDTRPAAVGESHLDFEGKDKDSELFRDNIDPYLAQYPAGSPPLDPSKIDSNFNIEQYKIFKSKFGRQTTAVISGDDVGDFSPAQVFSGMTLVPEGAPDTLVEGEIPYEFSLTRNDIDVPSEAAGPVAGAVIAVTPDLEVAAKAVAGAKSLREKAEALQFITEAQRNAFAAASSVASQATKVGAPVYVVGGTLPGFESLEPSAEDVKEARRAMDIDESGTSRLNYFIQVFRSSDFPIYEDYAVHRNKEGSPYQIIVTK
mmetsp:Transcript_15261/g.22499  ORF Transcript_15261/g.22499 Transcript_15261/m.22499 type:complete len:483 (+) Transcript_15261:180-1628(+)